jgi:hypothetical protein
MLADSGLDSKILEVKKLAIGDPLLKLLTRSRTSPILIGIAYSVVFHLLRLFAAWRAGHLRTVGVTTGFFDNPALYTNLVAGAIFAAYYTWLPRGILALSNGLCRHKVIDTPLPTVRWTRASFVRAMQASFEKCLWHVIPLAVAISATLLLILPQYLANAHVVADRADTFSLVLTVLWVLFGLYFVMLILFYGALSTYWLHRLFKSFRIRVRPLYPDRAGGLSPLGDFTLSLSYLITLIGLMLVVTPITRNYVAAGTWRFYWTTELVVGLGAYIVLAPLVFFAPLAAAHTSMKEAKEQLLALIARRFESEYRKVQKILSSDDLESDESLNTLKSSLGMLRKLQALHDTTDRFPVWPFDTSNLRRFGTSFVSPIVLAIVADLASSMF